LYSVTSHFYFFFFVLSCPPRSTLFAYTTLFRSRMRADDGRAIPTFIRQAMRGEPITVHGTGAQTRSICYVSDLVDGILALLDSRSEEHTSELQSRRDLVCRLLLEKKNKNNHKVR